MKKLFAIIFSLQLILSPVALAESGGYNMPGTEEGTGASDAYMKTGTGSSGGYDFYVSQIMTLATSAIGGSIISQCLEGLKTPSIATFMGGSVIHIMAEIGGAKAKNERHQKKFNDLSLKIEDLKRTGDSSQKAALEAMLQEEKDTLKFLEERKKWLIAVTTIYTASAGLAIAEEVYGQASSNSAAYLACGGLVEPADVLLCGSGVVDGGINIKASETLPQARERVGGLCLKWGVTQVGCQTFTTIYTGLVYAACQLVPVDGGASMLSWNTLLSVAYGFGSSQLGAGGGQISQYGTMLLSLLNVFVPSFSKFVVAMYNFPIPRSITFGAAAVFSGVVTAGLVSREKRARSNIAGLEKVISEFKVQTEGDTSVAPVEGGEREDREDPKKKTLGTIKIEKKKECFSQGAKGFQLSSSGCSRPLKLTKSNFGQFKLPAIGMVGGLSERLADALASGDNAQAGQIAGEIGTYAARVKAETEQLKAIYNNNKKKNNRPTTDFDKSIKAQVASMQQSLNQAAAQNNIDLASMRKASGESEKDEKVSDAPAATAGVAGPQVIVPSADPLAGIGETEIATEAPMASKPEQSLDDFETNEQDISKKSDVSLFKQLSNRYILNYTKIFERKKEVEVVEEPEKK